MINGARTKLKLSPVNVLVRGHSGTISGEVTRLAFTGAVLINPLVGAMLLSVDIILTVLLSLDLLINCLGLLP